MTTGGNEREASAIEAESELREENQITLPEPVVDALGASPGDRFVWVVEDARLGVIRLHRIPSSYAGSLSGEYGSPTEVERYLAGERASWDE